MARKRQLQTTFIAGELAPDLGMRVDTKQYANGAKSLLNRRCLIGGGTSRRPGTATCKDCSAAGQGLSSSCSTRMSNSFSPLPAPA
jgi:hypothetical protein